MRYAVTYVVSGTYTVTVEADSEKGAMNAADEKVASEIHDFGDVENGEISGIIDVSEEE